MQKSFLMRAWGASPSYSGKTPAKAHEQLAPILSGHFDRRLRILEETLREFGVSDENVKLWVASRAAFARPSSTAERPADTVKTIPVISEVVFRREVVPADDKPRPRLEIPAIRALAGARLMDFQLRDGTGLAPLRGKREGSQMNFKLFVFLFG